MVYIVWYCRWYVYTGLYGIYYVVLQVVCLYRVIWYILCGIAGGMFIQGYMVYLVWYCRWYVYTGLYGIAGGMFILGAEGSSDAEKYRKLAADITHTCHESYDRTGKSTTMNIIEGSGPGTRRQYKLVYHICNLSPQNQSEVATSHNWAFRCPW